MTATEIHSRKVDTLENTLGKGDWQSTREKEVAPTSTNRPDLRTISGPPLSPVHVVSRPVGPLKVQIILSVMWMLTMARFITHVTLGTMFSSTYLED